MSTLLVTVDALRRDHLSQYGYDRNTFPAVDRLLNDGATRFNDAVSNGTYTGISLPSILTSRYLGDANVRAGPTVASRLPDHVTTGAIHSNTFFSAKFDSIHGVDIYEDFQETETEYQTEVSLANRVSRRLFDTIRPWIDRLGLLEPARRVQEAVVPASLIHDVTIFESAERTTDRAIEFLDGIDGEFFLWVHYMDPHRPYGINADPPAYGHPAERQEIFDLMAEAGIHPDRIDNETRRRIIDLYDSAIRYTSTHVSRLFDALEDRNRWEDLSVLFSADHGEEFGEHGRYFHRNRPYDECIRVPLIVKSPRSDAETVDEARELLDITPTICAEFNVDPPEEFLGTNLFAGGSRRQFTTGSFRDSGQVISARWDGWKYLYVEGEADELYDLSTDPGETENLAERHPDQVEIYRKSIPGHLFEANREGVPDRDDVEDDVEARLEGLGYLE